MINVLKLENLLKRLKYIVFEDGSERGFATEIPDHLSCIRGLLKESGIEFNKSNEIIINPNENQAQKNKEMYEVVMKQSMQYQELLKKFPGWTDINNLTEKYKAMDKGPFAGMFESLVEDSEESMIKQGKDAEELQKLKTLAANKFPEYYEEGATSEGFLKALSKAKIHMAAIKKVNQEFPELAMLAKQPYKATTFFRSNRTCDSDDLHSPQASNSARP